MSSVVCYCFGVDKARIVAAIEGGCSSVAEIKRLLGVTGNCAGCLPDIEALLAFYSRFPRRP